MLDLSFKYKPLLSELKKEAPFKPELAIILGSGLGNFARQVNSVKVVNTSDLPGYPPSTIEGHEGKIHFAEYEGKKLLLFQGRIHFYEGYPMSECVLPAFIPAKLGCTRIFITNAAGGINRNLHPGDLMLISSFNGINMKKDLTDLFGIASEETKNKMLNLPSKNFSAMVKSAALDENIELKEGVYWYNKGPAYETPAEIRMTERFGGDAVGMSTVQEAVMASYLGLETAAVSCITNYAAGITGQKLSHADVTETAKLVEFKFEKLVKRVILNLK